MAKGNLSKLAARASGRPRELKFTIASGAGANTDIAISGIKRNSLLVSVIEVPASTTTLVDRTATTSVTSDGNIQCTSSTSGNQVLVVWYA